MLKVIATVDLPIFAWRLRKNDHSWIDDLSWNASKSFRHKSTTEQGDYKVTQWL